MNRSVALDLWLFFEEIETTRPNDEIIHRKRGSFSCLEVKLLLSIEFSNRQDIIAYGREADQVDGDLLEAGDRFFQCRCNFARWH